MWILQPRPVSNWSHHVILILDWKQSNALDLASAAVPLFTVKLTQALIYSGIRTHAVPSTLPHSLSAWGRNVQDVCTCSCPHPRNRHAHAPLSHLIIFMTGAALQKLITGYGLGVTPVTNVIVLSFRTLCLPFFSHGLPSALFLMSP